VLFNTSGIRKALLLASSRCVVFINVKTVGCSDLIKKVCLIKQILNNIIREASVVLLQRCSQQSFFVLHRPYTMT